ncbi:proline-specific permease ProY, partial [Acinetobacter baumannii]
VFILVMMGYFPDSRPAIYVGITWLALLTIAYRIWVKPEQSLGKESEPVQQNIEMES